MTRRRVPSSRRARSRRKANYPYMTLALGCAGCSLLSDCGGIRDNSGRIDCRDDCCGGKSGCDIVCPRNRDYAARVGEIGGFAFPNLPTPQPAKPAGLPLVMPVIYHRYRRDRPLQVADAAVPLFRVLSRFNSEPLYRTPDQLRSAFLLSPDARIFLSGVDRDAPLERFWAAGQTRRRDILLRLADLGISGISTPNFSTFTDVPRPDAMHALVRIALIFDEMQQAGLPAVLHLNGMFERDYERLAEWIARHPGITHVAVEFGTGTRSATRAALHKGWLLALASRVGRPLHLVQRGGAHHAAALSTGFAGLTVLETDSFCKTMYRREAVFTSNTQISWRPTLSFVNQSLDDLLGANVFVQGSVLRDLIRSGSRAA